MDGSISLLPESRASRALAVVVRVWRPAAVVAAAAVLAVAAFGLTRTALFRVRAIDVDGASHLSRREVIELAEISTRDNALWLNDEAAEGRLTSHAWVADADVVIDLPWRATVIVTERSPIAVVERASSTTYVAADGTNLGTAARARGLPTIVAPPARIGSLTHDPIPGVARALGEMSTELRAAIERVTLGPSGIELVLRRGVRVVYGSAEEAARKATAIDEVLAWVEDAGLHVRSINVSAPSAPAVVPVR